RAAAITLDGITAALGLLKIPAPVPPAPPVGASLRATVTDSTTISAVAAIVVAGVTTGVSAVLVPVQLHADGASSGEIGLAFSVAGMLFVAGSTPAPAAGRPARRLP